MTSLASKPRLVARERRNQPLAVWCCGAALFTVSWDRLLSFNVATFTVKVPIILFGVAACFLAADAMRHVGVRSGIPFFVVPFALLFADLALVAIFATDPKTALLQTCVLAIGSVIPGVVAYMVAVRYAALDFLLTRLIQGGYLAAGYVCYEILGGRLGLPLAHKFSYPGLSGGAPRYPGFNYEPAYFGFFIILVIAALLARAEIRRQSGRLGWQIAFFIVVLFVSNTRASYLTVPTFFLLVYLGVKTRAARSATGKVLMAGIVATVLGLSMWYQQVSARIGVQLESLFNAEEPTSNSPRLGMLNIAWAIWRQHPYGVGPGNLINFVSVQDRIKYLSPAEGTPLFFNRVIVNNVWLQALIDGGMVAFFAQVLIVLLAVIVCYRRSLPAAAILISGWLTIVLVGGMITSYFYDLKVCTALGLAAAAAQIGSSTTQRQQRTDTGT